MLLSIFMFNFIFREEATTATNVRRLIVVLEGAQLEVGKVVLDLILIQHLFRLDAYSICYPVTSTKHLSVKWDAIQLIIDQILHIRFHTNFYSSIFQCLLMLMDSPLNRVNMLRVYVHTARNVLIEINPQTRIPRTYDRFAALMGEWFRSLVLMVYFAVQLLNKLCIRAADSSQKLLKVVKNPVHIHLPAGCLKFGTSFNATHLSNIHDIVPKVDLPPVPIVIVVGAIARGAVCLCSNLF